MANNYAIDTAARFGDIPFVEFTRDLVTGVFDSLVEAHILQMEEYATFVNSLTQSLSTYINNTVDGVSFDQISDFILNYELPQVTETELGDVLELLDSPGTGKPDVLASTPTPSETWWDGLINALAPAIAGLVDKIDDPSEQIGIDALNDYNNAVLSGATIIADVIPNYKQIHNAIASLIASNKYGLLQTMAKQGVMRLVVTEGEIETKITFSTWNNTSSSSETGFKKSLRDKIKTKNKIKGGIFGFFGAKKKKKHTTKTITVNTAKSYQRDSSGTRVNIFGRVLIRFKTDYATLNG